MILAAPAFLAILAGLATRGKLSNLDRIPLRWLAAIVVGFVVQLLAVSWAANGTVGSLVYRVVLMVGMGIVGTGLWGLRRLPWATVAILGLGLNILVMVANGGTMTVTSDLVQRNGFQVVAPHGEERLWGGKEVLRSWDQTPLPFLSDWIEVRVGGFVRILSPGDIVLAIGIGLMVLGTVQPLTQPSALGKRLGLVVSRPGGTAGVQDSTRPMEVAAEER